MPTTGNYWVDQMLEQQALEESLLDPGLQESIDQFQAAQNAQAPDVDAMLEQELNQAEMLQSMVPTAESRVPGAEEMAALSKAKQAQLGQQIGQDRMTDLINQYSTLPRQMDMSGLLALADAWGTDKSNFAQAYQRPTTPEQHRLKAIELQNLLLQRREEQAKGQREQLKLALLSRNRGQMDPLKEEERRARIAMYKAAATGRAQNLEDVKDSQALTAGYGRRMEQSENVFDRLEKQGFNRAKISEGLKASLPGFAQPSLTKQQEQAERNFINAQLRRESGAAISQGEYDSAEKQYFPRPGDSPEVLEQKRANRQQAVEGMKIAAGRAWSKVPLIPQRPVQTPEIQQKMKRLQELKQKAGQ